MSNYWAEREAKHIEEMLKRHVNYEQEIHRRYLKLWETIEAEIQQFYVAYAGKEKISIDEAKRRVSKHDVQIFAEKAKRYVQT
ncbi:MAG: phage head morphogenesis protein, partial [Staphylococcus sp.]|nr:phage head morphogenesis protein [Staphylococcus sp.]